MRKGTIRLALPVLGLAGILLSAAIGYAQSGTPSSKATAKVSYLTLIKSTDSQDWTTILSNTLKTPNQKDLFISVSLECGLYTQTLASSKGGAKDTSTARAVIQIRVLIDGVAAAPEGVTFASRNQTLSATLEGMIGGALTTDLLGNVIIDETLVTPEQIELIVETTNANAYNFVLADLGTGVHTIQVQTRIASATTVQNGTASAQALVGKGSMTVEQVRMIRNEDMILE